MTDLQGRVALVTGGAKRIGRSISEALAAAGYEVALHYGSSQSHAEQAVAAIQAGGGRARAFQADLADPDAIAGLFNDVEFRMGRLDVLVNSAATFESASLLEIGPDEWDHVLAVNLRAPFLCLQHAARLMASAAGQSPGVVINIADLSGVHAWSGFAHHAVSKAGLIHLTKVAARELGPAVRVNAVIPGPVLPPPGQDAGDDAWQRRGEGLPLGRTGEPADVARAVLFLATNDFVTGVALRVDGGEGLLGPHLH